MHHIHVLQLPILKLDARAALFSVYRCEILTKAMNDLFQQRAQTPTVGLRAGLGHLISQLQCSAYLLGYSEEVKNTQVTESQNVMGWKEPLWII